MALMIDQLKAKLRTEIPGWLNELLARMLDEDTPVPPTPSDKTTEDAPLRGGSYPNDGSYVRSAFRGVNESTQAHKGYGFRVVVLP